MEDNLERHKAIIVDVLTSAFTKRDFGALEKYVSPNYIQHNHYIPPHRSGLRRFIESLAEGTVYEHGMIVAEGNLVMVHGRYSGATAVPLVAVDIFRFEDGLVVEHWDVLQDELKASATVSGNSMFELLPVSRTRG
jgi:predicted SnoaL-like aldol condensation-catalyzing enzyme